MWSASKLTGRLESGVSVPDKVAVITIDDAYRSLPARPGKTGSAHRQRILEQVATAQRCIDAEVPEDCRRRIFSYPYGELDSLAEEALADAGYTAFGQQSGPVAAWDSLQALPRFPVNQAFANSELMTTKLQPL